MTPEGYGPRLRHGAYVGGVENSTHAIWRGMLARCLNPANKDYPRYGGRGIKVCVRWLTYVRFLEDMGARPEGLSLERDNNDGPYTKLNCRWATAVEQGSNKRNNVWLCKDGEVDTLTGWARTLGISKALAHWRLKTHGALTKDGSWQLLQSRR